MLTALVLTAPLLATSIPAAQPATPETLIAAHAEAFNRSDATALAALYVDDGRVFPAHGRPVRGRAEIEKFWRTELTPQRRGPILLASTQTETRADIAYAIGTWGLAARRETGTFTMCFKRDSDGTWKILSSMWNENAPFGYTPLVPR